MSDVPSICLSSRSPSRMKLSPKHWTWNSSTPSNRWAEAVAAGLPAIWQAHPPEDIATRKHLASLLSADEQTRLASFKQAIDQTRYLTSRGLLRLLIGAHLGIPAERLQFEYGPFGKPFLVAGAGHSSLHFNVAHSGNLILLAFSPRHEVGVDVEQMRQIPEMEAIAAQVFSENEHERWMQLGPEARVAGFYRQWTCQEAGLKALGLGLGGEVDAQTDAALTRYEVDLPPGYAGAAALFSGSKESLQNLHSRNI